MIKLNQYQIVFGFKTEGKAVPITYGTKEDRDKTLLSVAAEDIISLIDIELTYDNDYKLLESSTSVLPLK